MKGLFSSSNKKFLGVFIVLSIILIMLSYINFKWSAIIMALILADFVTDIGLGRGGNIQMKLSEKVSSWILYGLNTIKHFVTFIFNKSKYEIQDHHMKNSKK